MKLLPLLAAGLAILAGCAHEPEPDGALQIRAKALDSEIVITAGPRFAGAIYSLVFRGREHVNADDNGRELQSASSFDALGECYNPTEAGSRDDRGRRTSSVLLRARAAGHELATSTRMAFWVAPGEAYRGPRGPYCGTRPEVTRAQNATVLSDHVLHKQVTIGFEGLENVIEYRVAFDVPEARRAGVFEAVTGYMPPEFTRHLLFDSRGGLSRPSLRGREQPLPVILSTEDGNYAMGVYSPELPRDGRGYGHFSFSGRTEKWNCVFREPVVEAGRYCYRCFVAVGTLDEVRDTIQALHTRFSGSQRIPPARAGQLCPAALALRD